MGPGRRCSLFRNARIGVLVVSMLLAHTFSHSTTAFASAADEAEIQFRLGNGAFIAEKYERALGHYFASVRLAPNRNVKFNVARCYEKLRRYVEAYRYYLEYADGANTKEKATVSQALARIKRNVALVSITSDPPGATIYLNRKDLGSYGTTPQLLPVKPGPYTVILERSGYRQDKRATIKASAGQTATVNRRLERLIGRLNLSGDPAGAKISLLSLDTRPAGELGAKAIRGILPFDQKVPSGPYRLTVQHPRYIEEVRTITVKSEGETAVKLSLGRATGSLVVQAEESGALVSVDGQPRGFTPAVLDNLPTGRRRLEVRARGFKPFFTEVSIEVGKRVQLDAVLRADNAVSAATRRSESVTDAPASVTAVNADEIAAHGDQTLADTLRGVRGLFITDDLTYGFAGVRGFSRPGQYGQRLMIQLDGHALNDDWLGGSFIEHDLMAGLHALERVEVVRGPLSALYGTGAFLGVVNMVTPSAVDRVQLTAGTAMAGFNTFKAYARVGIPLGDEPGSGLWIYGGGMGRQPGNYFSPSRAETATGVGGTEGGSVMTKATWRDLTVSGFFNQRRKTIPTASFGTLFGDTRESALDRRAFVDVSWTPKLSEDASLKVRLTYDHYDYEGVYPYAIDDGGVARETYSSDWLGAEVAGLFKPASWAQIDVGAHYQYHFNGRLDGRDDDEVYASADLRHHSVSLYALTLLQPIQPLRIFAGVRFDGFIHADLEAPGSGLEDRFFWTLNPNLSVVANPWTDGTLKLIFGRGFRAPSAYELGYDDGGRTQIAAPGLTPEDIYSGEVEYRHALPAGFWVTSSVFLSATDNLIELTGEGSDTNPLQFANRAETIWTLGAELEIGKTLRRGIQLNLHYAYQNTRAGKLLAGRELVNSPEHSVGAKAIVPLLNRTIRLATKLGVQTGRLDRSGGRTEPTVQWDVTLSGEIPSAGLRYAVGLRNMLDWQTRHPVAEDVDDLSVLQNGVELTVDLSFSL